jgi:hypothetical protein
LSAIIYPKDSSYVGGPDHQWEPVLLQVQVEEPLEEAQLLEVEEVLYQNQETLEVEQLKQVA